MPKGDDSAIARKRASLARASSAALTALAAAASARARTRNGGEMYGPGRMGYLGRGRRMTPHPGGRGLPPLAVLGLVFGGLFLFSVAGAFDFFPFFFFFWMIPFFLVPALGLSVRSVAG